MTHLIEDYYAAIKKDTVLIGKNRYAYIKLKEKRARNITVCSIYVIKYICVGKNISMY